MEFRILGSLEAYEGARLLPLGGVRQRALLSILILHANEVVTTDRLIDELWRDEPPQAARKALQVAMSRLRKLLEPDDGPGRILLTRPAGYTLEIEPDQLDLGRFERLRGEGRDALERGDAARAGAQLREALALWRGPPLADVAFEPWAQVEVARLDEARLAALEDRIDADLALGRHGDLVGELEMLVGQEPLRERLRGQLMLALYRCGRQADALEAFQEGRRLLVDDLGIEPSRSLSELQTAILAQDPSLELASTPGGPGPTGTVTTLFTDLVGSTALFSRLDRETADELRRTHFSLLRDAVAATNGTEVKSLGDGLMVVFSSVSAALECATAMQQQIERDARRRHVALEVRIGVSHGEVTAEAGDYFGEPVIEAARLCSTGPGGRIVATEVVRMLAGTRGEHQFSPLGALALKGLPEPVAAYELRWEPLPARPPLIPLPGRLASSASGDFFGRSGERNELSAALERARGGERQLVLLSGEPGIGKTRLAAEVAGEAHRGGATVLYGRCDEEVGPPYQPFVEAVGHYVEHAGDDLLARHLSARTAELARLVPGLADERGPSRDGDSDGDRYVLFAAVASLLASASSDEPIVLVLDDLHWAEKPTVLMLRHLVSSAQPMSMCVIATYRSTELPGDHPLLELLAWLHREPGTGRIALEGLEGLEVAELVGAVAGQELGEAELDLARTLHQETSGNPFFVREMLRHLVESGAVSEGGGHWRARADFADVGLPGSVREVLTARVARLGPSAHDVLSLAAVCGREFDLDLLSRVVQIEEQDLLDVLDGAVEAALLGEAPGARPRFSFSHALVEHTLYETFGPAHRGRAHRRVAEALEELCGPDTAQRAGELAHHWLRASPAAAGKALEYARQEADRALARLAPHAAARWYGEALGLLEQLTRTPDRERCELLIGLGDAQRQSGDAAFRETLLEAGRLARRSADGDLQVRAVLANSRGFVSASGEVDEERVAALEAALAVAGDGDGDGERRAGLLATLGAELAFSGDWERRTALSDEALALARRAGDPATLSRVLTLRFVTTWAPETLDERLDNTEENVALADRLGDPTAQFGAVHWRAAACIEAGRLDEATRAIDREGVLAERLGQPTARWLATYDRANLHLMAGRLEDAEASADEALQIALGTGQPDALPFHASQVTNIRYDQGRLAELQPLIAQTVAANPGIPGFRALLALACCEGNLDGEARRILMRDAATDFSELPYDLTWLTVMVIYSEVAARLGEAEVAGVLYRCLERWQDQFVFNGVGAWGAVSRALGLLAATLGWEKEAESHFEAALARHEQMRLPVWMARTRLDLAQALLAGQPSHALDRARSLVAEALGSARELGLAGIERRAENLGSYADALGDLPAVDAHARGER